MDTEEGKDKGEDHTSDSSIQLHFIKVPLNGVVPLHNSENFNNPKDSQQSI